MVRMRNFGIDPQSLGRNLAFLAFVFAAAVPVTIIEKVTGKDPVEGVKTAIKCGRRVVAFVQSFPTAFVEAVDDPTENC